MKEFKEYLEAINDPVIDGTERLTALKLFEAKSGKNVSKSLDRSRAEINNHIHTIYSFSPYSPAMAAFLARNAGLAAAGSVDHDSITAADEMLSACSVLGIGGCAGFEVRVSFKTSVDGEVAPFAERKLNNPDSVGYAYMTVQGIPRQFIRNAVEFLEPLKTQRLKRTKAMTVSANMFLREAGFSEIDFEQDIICKSKYSEGGSITERHLLAATAEKITLKYGRGPELIEKLTSKMGITVSPKLDFLLSDINNPHYIFDLLGILKAEFLPRIYIQPEEGECIPVKKVTAFADSICAISAYAYLGDICESPTGDKKTEKFEDAYIEELFAELSRLGYRAVAYMPPRNTVEQLRALRKLSTEWGFMEISGVDINSSRQSFNCPEVLREEFCHLVDTTWALIAHERLASVDTRYGLFSDKNPLFSLDLARRFEIYGGFGKKLDLYHPDESASKIAIEIDKGRNL